MGLFSWLFGGKEEAPPEPLVFGAELRCPSGTESSYLMLQADSIDISNLPMACVEDSEKFVNIMPFGLCSLSGVPCELYLELDEQWVNDEPQKMLSNGKEIITTKSTLLCKRNWMEIYAVTSGQDGVAAARMAAEKKLAEEMEKKYPGLLSILLDPYGSLYLNEGMYLMALQFLEDSLEKYGGELEFISLFAEDSEEIALIRSALDHLMPSFNMMAVDKLMDSVTAKEFEWEMDGVPGWNRQMLNATMMEMIRNDSEQTARKVAEGGIARWQEENKQFLQQLSEVATGLTFAYICYRYSMPTEDELAYRRELAGRKSYVTENGGGKQSAFKIGNNDKLAQNLTKEDIIDVLDNGTIKSKEVATGLRNGDIKLNVLGNELFESYLGCSTDTVAMQVGNQIYVRSSSASIFSDVVHEGIHAIDFLNGVDETIISSWIGETSAYEAEREFQLLKGFETQFISEEDMMVHIWSNYNH